MSPSTLKQPPSQAWWREASVYQIYPSSFNDSNGDGVGDIPGIIEKLDYIKTLGTDIVWVCPVYPSPMVDMGYDISDYYDIDPKYGTLDDIDELIKGLHERGIKFLMDLVVNHTSDQHKWFQDSKSSKENAFRDWYIWRPARYDANGQRQPPNNWSAFFGGSAWEWDETTGEYYLHLFAKEQPDLNWENPAVRDAVHKIIRFWLDKGVDGFRMDVINFISKVPGLPDAKITIPENKYQLGAEFFACGPRLHEYLQEMGKIFKEYDAFSVGEMPCVQDPDEIINAVGADRGELNMIFNFEIVNMDHGKLGKYSPKQWYLSDLKSIVNKWQTFMQDNRGWNALYLENHDQSRAVTRWASDKPEFRNIASGMFAAFLALQSGTVFVYQGQELGMANMPESWDISEYRDLEVLNHWEELKNKPGVTEEELASARREYHLKSRDHGRLPIQWDSTPNAGFSTGTPWIRVNDDYKLCNAKAQVGRPGSAFEHWRAVLALRKELRHIFVYGDFEMIDDANQDVFAYTRSSEAETALVVCNFRQEAVSWAAPPSVKLQSGKVLLSNYPVADLSKSSVVLRPYEAIVVQLDTK